MKKLNLVFAILIAFVTFTSCNKKTELTPQQSLVQNGPWVLDHFELLNVVNNGNTDFDEQEFLAKMSEKLDAGDILKLTFNQDGTGSFTSLDRDTKEINSQTSWTWEVTTANELKMQIEGNETEIHKNLVVTEKHLEFIVFEDDDLATNVTGDIIYVFLPKE